MEQSFHTFSAQVISEYSIHHVGRLICDVELMIRMQEQTVRKLIDMFKNCSFNKSAEALEELLSSSVCFVC